MLPAPFSSPPSPEGDLLAQRRSSAAGLAVLASLIALAGAPLALPWAGRSLRMEGLPSDWGLEREHIGRICSEADRTDDTAAYLTCRELGLLR